MACETVFLLNETNEIRIIISIDPFNSDNSTIRQT